MQSFKKYIGEASVTPGDLKAQAEGKKAARKGQKYDENPYEKGSSRHLQWSKGHNAARAGMLKKEEVEQIDEAAGYKATSEKSQFGGHRAHLKNPDGKTSYMGAAGYKKPEHAKGEAQAYHDAYFGGPGKANERAADRAVAAYRAKHKEHMHVKESVDLDESEINELTAQYINENNISVEQLENMTEEELNELIGKAIGGAFKVGAKAAVGAARLAGKAAKRMSTAGRADAAEKKADSMEKKNKDRERIKAAQDRLRKAKEAARNK